MGKSRAAKREEYERYLASSRWQTKRAIVLAAAGYRCQTCGHQATSGLHVHHLHYRNFGDERVEDLRVLCEPCHKKIHERPEKKEKAKRAPTPRRRQNPRKKKQEPKATAPRGPIKKNRGMTKKQKLQVENHRLHELQVRIKARKAPA